EWSLHFFITKTAHDLVDHRCARRCQFLDVFHLILGDAAAVAVAAQGLAMIFTGNGGLGTHGRNNACSTRGFHRLDQHETLDRQPKGCILFLWMQCSKRWLTSADESCSIGCVPRTAKHSTNFASVCR